MIYCCETLRVSSSVLTLLIVTGFERENVDTTNTTTDTEVNQLQNSGLRRQITKAETASAAHTEEEREGREKKIIIFFKFPSNDNKSENAARLRLRHTSVCLNI